MGEVQLSAEKARRVGGREDGWIDVWVGVSTDHTIMAVPDGYAPCPGTAPTQPSPESTCVQHTDTTSGTCQPPQR